MEQQLHRACEPTKSKQKQNQARHVQIDYALYCSSEIRKAVWPLKNNKSPGMDQINVEQIKYSPEVVYEKIADIYNNNAATGKHPNHARNLKSTTKARKTKRTNIKSSTNNSFIPS